MESQAGTKNTPPESPRLRHSGINSAEDDKKQRFVTEYFVNKQLFTALNFEL